VAIAFFAAGVATMWHAVDKFHQGIQFIAAEYFGLSLILFGACFDPVNAVCLGVPWIWRPVARFPTVQERKLVFLGRRFAHRCWGLDRQALVVAIYVQCGGRTRIREIAGVSDAR
jgi:hypothetical protein